MARRILITGATGTVGGAVMRALGTDAAAGGIELFGAARSEASAAKLRDQGFATARFDYDRPETMCAALDGVEAVFLATGYTVDMLVHAKRLLDAAKAAGVRHIVHLGALAADDTPHAHFAWHQLIERTTEAMGFSWTHLRPNFFMDTVWAGLRQRPDRLTHFVGNRTVSWIASDDMAAVAAAALRDPDTHAGKTYPLAVESMSFGELATLLSDIIGRTVEYRPRPAADLLPILLKQGMEQTYAKSLSEGVAATEAGSMPLSDAVFDTVAQVTGRQPVTWRDYATARLAELG